MPWRDRLANLLHGCGFVSKSTREAKVLQRATRAGISCAEVVAHGANGRQAFVLLRERAGMTELRRYLQDNPRQQRNVARALGRELARMHAAGFEHGELFVKHILVGGPLTPCADSTKPTVGEFRFCFLDWQRARQLRVVPWKNRCRDLAALDATMLDSLATDGVRLTFLWSYLRSLTGPPRSHERGYKNWAMWIRRLSLRLQQKPRIRDLRRLPLPAVTQNLVWLDGEALCLTRAFHDEVNGQIPHWLRFRSVTPNAVDETQVFRPNGRTGNLVRRSVRKFLSWLRVKPAQEVRHAALLFRLERFEVPVPKLLAFGQERLGFWQHNSFLLTETPPLEISLAESLTQSLSPSRRGNILRQAGSLLRGIHEAGFILGKQAAAFASICALSKDGRLILTAVDRLQRNKRPCSVLAKFDLPKLRSIYKPSGTDMMRFFLGHLGRPRLTADDRHLARQLLASKARQEVR